VKYRCFFTIVGLYFRGGVNKRWDVRCKVLCIPAVTGSCISITERAVSDTVVREAVARYTSGFTAIKVKVKLSL
jgi:hypothetical protein